jgi:hypothetical protein
MFMISGICCFPGAPAYASTAPGYPGISPAPLIDIRDVINVQGPDGTEPVFSVPKAPLEVKSNAVDAAEVDFIDKDAVQASVFVAVTKDTTYGHYYHVCNRFEGFTLDDAITVGVPDLAPGSMNVPQFWYMTMSKKGIVQKAFICTIYVDEGDRTFTVDSPWMFAAVPKNTSYIFNIQIWSLSQQDSYNILRRILARLSQYEGWQVKYADTQPMQPPSFIMDGDLTRMRVMNTLPQSQQVTIKSYMRYPAHKDQIITASFDQVLAPGINVIALPYANALDGNVYVITSSFEDQIYAGSGYWLSFGKGLTLNGSHQPVNASDPLFADDFLLGGAGVTGKIPSDGPGGLARTLNPNSLPVDISRYNCLSFWAKGDGSSYSVQLETEAVRNLGSHDFHQSVVKTDTEWRRYTIPFSALKQRGTDASKTVPFTGTDVISVAWEAMGPPPSAADLEIKDAAFINTDNDAGIKMAIGSSKMLVNGVMQDIDPGYQTMPAIVNCRTMVPIGAIIKALGGSIDWSAPDQKVTITMNNTSIVLTIGNREATVNGVKKTLDNSPFITDTGRTMVPLRFVAENIGYSVKWDSANKIITIQ